MTLDTIVLSDGYSGHTEIFHSDPIEEDEATVKLQCASPGKGHLFRWVLKSELERLKDGEGL
jgi:hypothetical protein